MGTCRYLDRSWAVCGAATAGDDHYCGEGHKRHLSRVEQRLRERALRFTRALDRGIADQAEALWWVEEGPTSREFWHVFERAREALNDGGCDGCEPSTVGNIWQVSPTWRGARSFAATVPLRRLKWPGEARAELAVAGFE